MGKPYQTWTEIKAELMKDADFSEEWLARRPFRQIASEVPRIRCEKGLTQRVAKLVGIPILPQGSSLEALFRLIGVV